MASISLLSRCAHMAASLGLYLILHRLPLRQYHILVLSALVSVPVPPTVGGRRMNAVGCVVLLLAGAQAGLRHLDSKARHPTSRIDSSHSRQRRMALVTKCSGKPRISFDQRSELIGAAAQAAGKVPHQGALDETRDTTGSREWKPSPGMLDPQHLIAAWRAVRTPHWPATTGQNLTRMCMVSVCSMINATQPDPGHVDVVSLVDEDTPQHIRDMYEKLEVRIVDLSDVSFPPRFNNRSYASSYKVRLWGNETEVQRHGSLHRHAWHWHGWIPLFNSNGMKGISFFS